MMTDVDLLGHADSLAERAHNAIHFGDYDRAGHFRALANGMIDVVEGEVDSKHRIGSCDHCSARAVETVRVTFVPPGCPREREHWCVDVDECLRRASERTEARP